MDEKLDKILSSLSELSKVQLSKILNSINGAKDLILEPQIVRPLEKICGVRWLKDNGVEKIYKLEGSLPANIINIPVIMIYSNMITFKKLLDQIRSLGNNKIYNVIIVPKFLNIYEIMLEELGLYEYVKLYNFQWFPILNDNILSLEVPHMYKNIFVKNDYSLLPTFAKTLWQLSLVIGKPKFILALGEKSNAVLKQLNTYKESDKSSSLSGLVIMDRNVDYSSVLLTPGTYTALLKEIFSLRCGICEYKEEPLEKQESKYDVKTNRENISFSIENKKDFVYNDIKYSYFTEVTSVLSSLTKQLRIEGEIPNKIALDEMKNFIKNKLPHATSKKTILTNHLKSCESIVKILGVRFEKQTFVEQCILQNKNKSENIAFLEELVSLEDNKFTSLRLMCLMLITEKLLPSEFKSFWKKYITEYGHKYGYVLNNLLSAGFIAENFLNSTTNKLMDFSKLLSNNFYKATKNLKQIPSDPNSIDLKSPNSLSYVFGGCYNPLIATIANMLINNNPLNEIRTNLSLLGEVTTLNPENYPLNSRSLLLYIVGGITYSEIAACNLLEKLSGAKIVLLSDQIISGNDIMEALF